MDFLLLFSSSSYPLPPTPEEGSEVGERVRAVGGLGEGLTTQNSKKSQHLNEVGVGAGSPCPACLACPLSSWAPLSISCCICQIGKQGNTTHRETETQRRRGRQRQIEKEGDGGEGGSKDPAGQGQVWDPANWGLFSLVKSLYGRRLGQRGR